MASQDASQPLVGSERSKYQSPPPPPSSMTPPPSSQAPQLAPPPARTPTPPHSHLSSPPPTVKAPPPLANLDIGAGMFSTEQISDATLDDLRSMLIEANASLREARASAAHHSLQYNLLRMESSEAMNRMEVELEMVQKEVEVLQAAAQQRSRITASPASLARQSQGPSEATFLDLKNHCRHLEGDNGLLRRRLADAKVALVERETAMAEENDRLRARIRDNRKHVNMLKVMNGTQPPPSASAPTPSQNSTLRDTRENRTSRFPGTPPAGNDNTFAALLLADQVLSQETGTTPSTPTREPKRHPNQTHTRGSQSLSSLPSTPHRNVQQSSKTYGPYYIGSATSNSPPSHVTSAKPPKPGSQAYRQPHTAQRRRESRDSTISASDLDQRPGDERNDNSEGNSDEEVPASQASQEAANLLRKSSSFRKSASNHTFSGHPPHSASVGKKDADTVQSKLSGYQVKKSGKADVSAKRKALHDSLEGVRDERHAKKGKYDTGEGVGLGIWTRS